MNSTTITEGITVDLGGASTEVTYFKDRRLIDSHSFPFGALTLKHILTKHQSTAQLQTYIEKQIKTLSWFSEKIFLLLPLVEVHVTWHKLIKI